MSQVNRNEPRRGRALEARYTSNVQNLVDEYVSCAKDEAPSDGAAADLMVDSVKASVAS